MTDQFQRTQMLLGNAAMERLKNAHVAIFGIGGVGSYTVEALARCGIGHLTLVDDDKVSLTNLNRQLIALHSTLDKPKVTVMEARIQDINPAAAVTARSCFFTEENADSFPFHSYDYVVDAIDTVSSKLTLICRAKAADIPVISSMGAGNKLHPELLELSDIYATSVCPLAKVMRRELKARGIPSLQVVYSKEPALTPQPAPAEEGAAHPKRQTPGSISFVPSAAGLILAGQVIRDLTKEVTHV